MNAHIDLTISFLLLILGLMCCSFSSLFKVKAEITDLRTSLVHDFSLYSLPRGLCTSTLVISPLVDRYYFYFTLRARTKPAGTVMPGRATERAEVSG